MTDNWNTPIWLKDVFGNFFDPCPKNPTQDGLAMEWGEVFFMNPPYSNPLPWVQKAIEETKKGKSGVLLLKVDPSTRWYKMLVENDAHFTYFNERLHYSESKAANFPSMLVFLEKKGSSK